MVCDNSQMEMGQTSPGLLLEMLNNRDYLETKNGHRNKSHRSAVHNDEDCAWIANLSNPLTASLQLSMMMDLAWDKNALTKDCKSYLDNWLSNLLEPLQARKSRL